MANKDTKLNIIVDAQDKTKGTFQNLNSSLGKSETSMRSLTLTAGKLVAGFYAIKSAAQSASGFIRSGLDVAATLQTAKVGLETLLGSADKAQQTIDRLKIEAARTPFELPGLTQATQLLSSVTKDGDRSIDILLDVGEGLAAMGKGQAELDRIIVNLQQIAAVGKAATIDIKQFAFAGIPIYEMLAETTGKSGEALGDFIEEGGVTFELLTKMFDEANDEGGRFFNAFQNQSGTFNQALSNMKDSFGIFAADVVTSSGLFQRLTDSMIAASDVMTNWRDVIADTRRYIEEHQFAITMIGGALIGILTPALIAATSALTIMAATAVLAFGSAVIAAAPLAIAGAAIAGAAYLIITNWSSIKVFFADLWSSVVEKTQSAWTSIETATSNTWTAVKDAFWTAVNFIIGAYATLLDFMVPGWDAALVTMWTKTVEVWAEITTTIGSALNSLTAALSTWLSSVKTAWGSAWSAVEQVLTVVWDSIIYVFSAAKEVIVGIMDEMIGPIKHVIDLAKEALALAGGVVGRAVTSIIKRGAQITGRASGGPVSAGTPYMVGEKGPELFMPSTSGQIIPNGRLMGGSSVVNIYGGTYLSEDAAEQMGDLIMNRLKLSNAL